MKKIAFFSDILFTFFVSGIFTLFLFRYGGVSLFPALFLSALCGGLTACAVGAYLQSKRKNFFMRKADEEGKKKLLLHLALLSDEAKTEYLTAALSTEEEPAKRFGKLRVFNKTQFFFLKFSLSPLAVDEIPNLARLKTGKKKVLLCAEIQEDALALCNRLDIDVKTGEWLYVKLKEKNALPDSYLGEVAPTKKGKRFKLWFSKKNAKRFLVSGALILLLSRLTPFYTYYLLLGCILLFTSVFVRIFGQA